MRRQIDMHMYQDNDGLYVLTINNATWPPMTLQEALQVMRNEGIT